MKKLLRALFSRSGVSKITKTWNVHSNFPNWGDLLGRDHVASRGKTGTAPKQRVLIATSIGGDAPSTTLESLIAVALIERGAEAEALLCDASLPACLRGNINNYEDPQEFVEHGPKLKYCGGCFEKSEASFGSAGIKVHKYGSYISEAEKAQADVLSREISFDDIGQFELNGLAVGEHALAGALRYFARGTLEGQPDAEPVLRRFLKGSILTAISVSNLLDREKYDVLVFSHGIYVPLGIVGEVARKKGVRVVNWVTAYRKQRFIFSHGDTYHHTMISEPVESWRNIPWTPELDKRAMDYLESRTKGTRDWIWFHEKPEEEMAAIARELGLDLNKPTIGLLTNVVWDAQLHFKANAFPNMIVWLQESIKYFAKRPDLQLVIRVHPAEIRGTVKSRQRVMDEIQKAFPNLPPNIFVIAPESPISTYAVLEVCDSVVIYGTKTGIELTSRGIPVIVAGEAWIRNKGLTLDAHSQKEYFEILDSLPIGHRLDEEARTQARKYAYHFFFRRMIPLPMVVPNEGFPPFKISLANGASDLAKGKSLGLDVICEGILEGKDFIYPDEKNIEVQLD
ncbi:capsular biosynthesis protein [Rhizobium sp. S95]|uniref:Capsular biosynthesis protein n=1 Tax=Ciceribacter sichuanensis TaxID=2949647 RepID=A0AAJ1BWT1_9HYPH|nr:capsular biosynthesis protein [Ciceribacter sp. S95]MCO5957714.1 capsular biosynthesis protein [Ciceribacter sp. S101]